MRYLHEARVIQASKVVRDGTITGFTYDGQGVVIKCNVQNVSADFFYNQFGLEVKDTIMLFVPIREGWQNHIEVGGQLVWKGDVYYILQVRTNEQGQSTDHTVIGAALNLP